MAEQQRFRYYVVYFIAATAITGGAIGRCFTSMDNPIETDADIEAVQHKIETDKGLSHNQVTIINWKRIH